MAEQQAPVAEDCDFCGRKNQGEDRAALIVSSARTGTGICNFCIAECVDTMNNTFMQAALTLEQIVVGAQEEEEDDTERANSHGSNDPDGAKPNHH